MKACPQKLPIPELLKEVTSEMEGKFFGIQMCLYRQILKVLRWKTFLNAK